MFKLNYCINFIIFRASLLPLLLLLLLLLIQLLPFVHNLSNIQNIDEFSPNAITALCSIIREYYVPNSVDFVVAVHAKKVKLKRSMADIVTQLLKHLDVIKVEIENINGDRRASETRKFNLILVDGVEALEELDPVALTRNFDITEYYLVYLVQPRPKCGTLAFVTSILKYFHQNYVINIGVLYESAPNSIELFTFFPFVNATTCQQNYVVSLNVFTGVWQNNHARNNIFPYKLLNLHNCTLRVAVWDTPPYLSYYPNKTGFDKIGDFEGEILTELAKKLNFYVEFIEPPNDEQRGKRFKNGTTTGAMKLLQERKADMSLGCFRYTLERCEVLTGALPYYQTWQIYGVLLSAQPYTALEILKYPFDGNTWLCLSISMCTTLLLGYLAHRSRAHSTLAKIIIGIPNHSKPLTNILSIFLGMAMDKRKPRTNFTRFIIVFWFIYGYLMRTIYQCFLFQLLQKDMHHEPPKTLKALIQRGYKLIMTPVTYYSVYTVPQIEGNMIETIFTNDTSELNTYAMLEKASDKRLAGVSPQDYLTHYVMNENKRGIFYVLPEKIFTQHITMYFSKHSYLVERFNFHFMNLRDLGLIDYWARRSLDLRYFEQSNVKVRNAICLDDIWGVFIVHSALITLACVVFGLELIWFKVKFLQKIKLLHYVE